MCDSVRQKLGHTNIYTLALHCLHDGLGMFVAKYKVGSAKEVSARLIIDAILQKRGHKVSYKNKNI